MSGPQVFRVNNPNAHEGMGVVAPAQVALQNMSVIFGANKYETVNATDGMPKGIETIKDYYSGSNYQLPTDIIKRIVNNNTWHFQCCPLVQINPEAGGLSKRVKKTLVFESHLPDSRAPFGTVNRLTSTEESTEWELEGRGIGIRFEYKYLMTNGGAEYMRQGIDVMSVSISDYHKLSIVTTMLRTPISEQVRDKLGQPFVDVADMMTGSVARNFCCFSKRERAYYSFIDWAKVQCRRADMFEPTMGIYPMGAAAQVVFGSPANLEANRAGEARAQTNLALGSGAMPTVQGVVPYEEGEYPFANVAARRVTKPMERVFQTGLHYISSPNLELACDPCYNEKLARRIQSLSFGGNVEYKTSTLDQMICADQNFDPKTGELNTKILSRLEGNGYETEFTELGMDKSYTKRTEGGQKVPAIHPYITVTNGEAKIIYFYGDSDSHYVPDEYILKLGITASQICQNQCGRSIDFDAISYIFALRERAEHPILFENGRHTAAHGVMYATGMDYRNASSTTSIFSNGTSEGGNFPPEIENDGTVFIYTEPGVRSPVVVTYGADGAISYEAREPLPTETALKWAVGRELPGFSNFADIRYMAGNPMYDVDGKIQKGWDNLVKLADYGLNIFDGVNMPNLMFNPDLCPSHVKVPNKGAGIKRNILSAMQNAFGFINRPVAMGGAVNTNGFGGILSGSNATGPSADIGNDYSGVNDLAAFLNLSLTEVQNNVISSENSTELLNTSIQDPNKTVLRSFEESVLQDTVGQAGLKRSGTDSFLTTWVKSMIARKFGRQRITRALNRAVNFLTATPGYIIDTKNLNGFEVGSQDENADVSFTPGTRVSRRENLRQAAKKDRPFIQPNSTVKILRISISGAVFDSLSDDELARTLIVPVSTLDSRRTPGTVDTIRNIGRAGNFETDNSNLGNTIFGHPDLTISGNSKRERPADFERNAPSQRGRAVGGAPIYSRRARQNAGPNNAVQTVVDDEGNWVSPSQDEPGFPASYANHALENRFFAEKLNLLNKSNLNPFQRFFASAYIGLPLNSKNFMRIANNGHVVPVTYLLFKPFITFRIGAGILTRPDVGVTETGFNTAMINVDTNVLAVDVNATFESGVGILQPRGVFVVDGVMFMGYEGGSGIEPIYTIDNSTTQSKARRVGAKAPDFSTAMPWGPKKDILVLSVSGTVNRGNLPHALDISGPLDSQLFNASNSHRFELKTEKSQQVEGMIALHLATNLAKQKPAIIGALDSYLVIALNAERRVNTLTVPGAQRNYNIKTGDFTIQDCEGEGPIGPAVPGTAAAFHGEAGLTERSGFKVMM